MSTRCTISALPTLAALLSTTWATTAGANPLDVVFQIDTTGSMSAEISEAKDRVRQIATALRAQRKNEAVRIGVVAYRDRGDEYLTLVSPLTADVDKTWKFLSELGADGGGDSPEDVLSGMEAALTKTGFTDDPSVDRAVFLIGDAPAHTDYQDGPTLETMIAKARDRRVVFHAVGCRSLPPEGVEQFRRIAYSTEGTYQHIGRVSVGGGSAKSLDAAVLAALDGSRAGPRTRLDVRLLDTSAVPDGVRGIEVRRAPGDGACTLEILLPSGIALTARPTASLGADALSVDLALGAGDGGRTRYAIAHCGEPALPLVVTVGGAP